MLLLSLTHTIVNWLNAAGKFLPGILLLFFSVNIYSQEARVPTAAEKAKLIKNFQTILQQVPSNFEKIRKGDAIDFFGHTTYFSTINLFPIEGVQGTQSIFYITEKDGKSVKTFTESVPFTFQSCIEMLSPVLKQNGMSEVTPLRKADSSMTVRSFKNKNAVVEVSLNPFTSGGVIVIGKPYYYYTSEAVAANNNVAKGQTNNNAKPTDDTKKVEDKILKGLTKLYKSAVTQTGSFEELKTGTDEMQGVAEFYDVATLVILESVTKAKLITTPLASSINGVAIDVAGTATPVYLAVLNKMAKSPETAGDIITEKKNGVTRYALKSKSLNKEVISLIDFEQPTYDDVIICNALYNKPKASTVTNNQQKGNLPYYNYKKMPPASVAALETEIQLELFKILTEQANVLDGYFSSMQKGNPEKLTNGDSYTVTQLIKLPNITEANLFVARDKKASNHLSIKIDPLITYYYINSVKAVAEATHSGNKKMGKVESEKGTDGVIRYGFTSSISGALLIIITDYPNPAIDDDITFL